MNDKPDKPHPEPGPDVQVTINGDPYTIHRGHQTVVAIKTVGHVALADELEQNVGGQLRPLPDDGGVTLKGGEIFVSHPRDSGSSRVK